mmetsp:Transcript_3125/g.13044  ORF Transcript_3125/g.13044 Transcript_3125/m.13044 type:complete len:239 (+) Transcript_3125:955-1671(+)
MRWRTSGPVSPRSENGRDVYQSPSDAQTSPPISFPNANLSASKPVTSSPAPVPEPRGSLLWIVRRDGHSTRRCFPRSSLEICPGGKTSSSAAHREATPHCDAGSLSAIASSSTSSFVGKALNASRSFSSRGERTTFTLPSLGLSNTSPTFRSVSPSRANHPTVSMLGANFTTPVAETAPCVGRKPKTPQCAAGTRTLPPESVPKPKATSFKEAATATAEPLDDPPGMRPGAAGFRGVP